MKGRKEAHPPHRPHTDPSHRRLPAGDGKGRTSQCAADGGSGPFVAGLPASQLAYAREKMQDARDNKAASLPKKKEEPPAPKKNTPKHKTTQKAGKIAQEEPPNRSLLPGKPFKATKQATKKTPGNHPRSLKG